MDRPIIYACSDSLGETAERVARAAASQYDKQEFNIVRLPSIRSEQQIEEIVQKATDENRYYRTYDERYRPFDRYGTDH